MTEGSKVQLDDRLSRKTEDNPILRVQLPKRMPLG